MDRLYQGVLSRTGKTARGSEVGAVPSRRSGPHRSGLEGVRHRGMTRWGVQGESVATSRPAEPGASTCPEGTRFDSSLADCGCRHRVPPAEEGTRFEGHGRRATPRPTSAPSRRRCGDASLPTKAWRIYPARGNTEGSEGRAQARELFRGRPYPRMFVEGSPNEGGPKGPARLGRSPVRATSRGRACQRRPHVQGCSRQRQLDTTSGLLDRRVHVGCPGDS